MLKYLRLLLLPFNVVYALVVYVRNLFFDWGIFQSTSFDMPIICVGNLAVGGSGKTPTTEYVVRLLSEYKVAILSRGYGRKTKGFVLADDAATAETIGDEPLQYYRKFKNVTVAVCEDRVKGIQKLKDEHEVILLDDAYQHRKVKAGFNVLLFEFSKITRFQMLMPAGNLREPFSGVKRAQAVLITKSPSKISNEIKAEILNKLIFRIAVGGSYFFEMAKLRAFKILFNQLSKEYGMDEIPYIFAETSQRNKAIADNNIFFMLIFEV